MTGLGFGLYLCHRDGMIGGWPFGAALLFLITASIGGAAMIGVERQDRRNSRNRLHEVPPPPDVYTVWPPANNTDTDMAAPRH